MNREFCRAGGRNEPMYLVQRGRAGAVRADAPKYASILLPDSAPGPGLAPAGRADRWRSSVLPGMETTQRQGGGAWVPADLSQPLGRNVHDNGQRQRCGAGRRAAGPGNEALQSVTSCRAGSPVGACGRWQNAAWLGRHADVAHRTPCVCVRERIGITCKRLFSRALFSLDARGRDVRCSGSCKAPSSSTANMLLG